MTLALLLALQIDTLRDDAAKALRRAVEHFRSSVATEGGCLWRYSEDLSLREGEEKASSTTVWIQPPGTPALGLAWLEAWEATGDRFYLEAARETALCLAKGQLRSGGWSESIEFDPALRKKSAYRLDPEGERQKNVSTLDDNKTQSSLLFLLRADRALDFKDEAVHSAAEYGLRALLAAQYPNGGWPQRFEGPAEKRPVKKAEYPETWPRTHPAQDYKSYYTLNDGLLEDLTDVLLEAARVYGREEYRQAAVRAADFLLLAQLPEPQPGWAQQYDAEMRPAWARKFEPPAVTGGEGQSALRVLMRVARETGDRKHLEPIPRALEYYRKSLLPDGRLARFYELRTNKPLYFTKDYVLTYDDGDLPTHYGFKTGSSLDRIAAEFEKLKDGKLEAPAPRARPKPSDRLAAEAKAAVESLDERGRWLSEGRLRKHDYEGKILDVRVFLDRVGALSRYLAASRPTVRVGGIVLKWIRGDKEANWKRAEPLIREAAAKGAKLVVTTECFLDGYAIADKSIPLDTYRALGEPIPDGTYFKRLSSLAAELRIHLVAGMLEADGDARHNTSVLLGPDGRLLGRYRKQFLEHESVRNTPGDACPVFATPWGKAGMLICADRRKPEIAARFKENGADFIIVPSGGMYGPQANDPIVQARSKETGLPIVFVHPAEFLVTGPDGSIQAATVLGDRLLVAPEEAGGEKDRNRVFLHDLPVR
jgi:PelA/Pel-15E family pectate lyase